MKITELHKATTLFERMKSLDAEIIQIEKYAMMVANGEGEYSFDLSPVITAENKKANECMQLPHFLRAHLNRMNGICDEVVPEYTNYASLKGQLSDTTTLSILGILLCDKQEKRKQLIESLQKMGFQ